MFIFWKVYGLLYRAAKGLQMSAVTLLSFITSRDLAYKTDLSKQYQFWKVHIVKHYDGWITYIYIYMFVGLISVNHQRSAEIVISVGCGRHFNNITCVWHLSSTNQSQTFYTTSSFETIKQTQNRIEYTFKKMQAKV